MIVYICAMILSIFFASMVRYKGKEINLILRNKKLNILSGNINVFTAFLSFLPLFIVSALRYDVGQDYFFTYVPIFDSVANTGSYENVEKGYILLNKFVLLFTKDYSGIFILTSLIGCYFIFKAIFQQSKIPAMSIFIYVTSTFYFISMNLVRQSITISIFFYSIKFIKEKKLKSYLITILIASTIHLTALIFIPIYFIANKKISFKKFIAIFIMCEIGLPLARNLIYSIISETKYAYYIGSVYDSKESTLIAPLISLLIVLLGYFYKSRFNEINDKYLNIYLNIQIIATLLSTTLGVFPLALRLFIDFEYIQILLVPSIIKLEKNRILKLILVMSIIICYGIYFYYTIGILGGSKSLPYRTIFSR